MSVGDAVALIGVFVSLATTGVVALQTARRDELDKLRTIINAQDERLKALETENEALRKRVKTLENENELLCEELELARARRKAGEAPND